jgi:hypothetical protein
LRSGFKYNNNGNLVEIMPPKFFSSGGNNSFKTIYTVNTLGQILKMQSPDQDNGLAQPGSTLYKYDNKGNMRFMRNEIHKQNGNDLIFYIYDELDRIKIIGEATDDSHIDSWNSLYGSLSYSGVGQFENWVTKDTYFWVVNCYDNEPVYGENVWYGAIDPGNLNNLKGHLAATAYYDKILSLWGYIYYSYNNYGQVETIIQDLPGNDLGVKKTEYVYDRQGNVTQIKYQDGLEDAFYIWNDYDLAGRLIYTYTGTTSTKPTFKLAEYTWWPTGKVQRKRLNDPATGNKVQGIDYMYNIRDWLLQVNDQNIGTASEDPGGDADDRFGEVVGYEAQGHIGSTFGSANQYNGNISWLITTTSGFTPQMTGYTFSYDNSYRLTQADGGFYSSTWQQHANNGFDERNLTYDTNGNLLTLDRYNTTGTLIHDFNYKYYTNTNRLQNLNNSASNNYTYDANGNMITDVNKGINAINYDFRNLPYEIDMGSPNVLKYSYDSQGQRIIKYVYCQ